MRANYFNSICKKNEKAYKFALDVTNGILKRLADRKINLIKKL